MTAVPSMLADMAKAMESVTFEGGAPSTLDRARAARKVALEWMLKPDEDAVTAAAAAEYLVGREWDTKASLGTLPDYAQERWRDQARAGFAAAIDHLIERGNWAVPNPLTIGDVDTAMIDAGCDALEADIRTLIPVLGDWRTFPPQVQQWLRGFVSSVIIDAIENWNERNGLCEGEE